MTDDDPNPTTPQPDRAPTPPAGPAAGARGGVAGTPAAHGPAIGASPTPPGRRPGVAAAPTPGDGRPRRPEYRGEELDPERGPGLGCFWFQVIVLASFLIAIPVGIKLDWPFEVLAILLFIVIGLLLLTGQTVIFLLRLVAADRRAQGRRRPLASTTRTVGELEDEQAATAPDAAGSTADAGTGDGATRGARETERADDREVDPSDDPSAGHDATPGEQPPADEGAPTADEDAPTADEDATAADEGAADAPPFAAPEEPDPGVRQ